MSVSCIKLHRHRALLSGVAWLSVRYRLITGQLWETACCTYNWWKKERQYTISIHTQWVYVPQSLLQILYQSLPDMISLLQLWSVHKHMQHATSVRVHWDVWHSEDTYQLHINAYKNSYCHCLIPTLKVTITWCLLLNYLAATWAGGSYIIQSCTCVNKLQSCDSKCHSTHTKNSTGASITIITCQGTQLQQQQ